MMYETVVIPWNWPMVRDKELSTSTQRETRMYIHTYVDIVVDGMTAKKKKNF